MSIIDTFSSKEDFLKFRDHVGKVLADERFAICLKKRKLDELAAAIAGATDFNTALGLCGSKVIASQDTGSVAGESDYYEIEGRLTRHGDHTVVKFDAVGYFEKILEQGNLPGIIFLLQSKLPVRSDLLKGVVRFVKDKEENALVEQFWQECFSQRVDMDVEIENDHISSWLMNKHQFVLSTWFDYLDDNEGMSKFSKYCQESESAHFDTVDSVAYHFAEVAGSDFKIRNRATGNDVSQFVWSYQSIQSSVSFDTPIDAVVDYLENLPLMIDGVHPQGAILDVRLSHFLVADEGYWGIGPTLRQAKRARPVYSNAALSRFAVVYRCSPTGRLNDEGGTVRNVEDPVMVRINPASGKPML